MVNLEHVNISVLGASVSPGNMGVNCLAAGAIKSVLRQYPRAEISFFDYEKESSVKRLKLQDREVLVPLVNIRFSKKIWLANHIALLLLLAITVKLLPFRWMRRWVIGRNRCLTYMSKADLVLALNGGDSFSDMYGVERLLYVSLPQMLPLLMGKKLVLLPQTVGPFTARPSRALARYILRRAARIYTRDHQSLRLVDRLAPGALASGKSTVTFDLGFVVDPVVPEHVKIEGLTLGPDHRLPLVGINVSGLLASGGYNHKNMFGLQGDYGALIRSLVDMVILERGGAVLLIPHVFGDGPENDVDACRRIHHDLGGKYEGRLGIVRGDYDQSEIKYVIGQCDLFVGSRMHACIGALSQHIPTVCIAYSDKFIGVMETIGIGDMVADARLLRREDILLTVSEAFERRSAVRAKLESKMTDVKKEVLELFAGLDNCSN
jgi:polysaccharide pyruvyl transferase WcaK-like protein